jgi:hypothetical protein
MKRAKEQAQFSMEPTDVEAALHLLETEREVGRSITTRSQALEFVRDLLIGCFYFGLTVGLTVVWSDLWVGVGLLVGAFVCLFVSAMLPPSGIAEETERIKGAIDALGDSAPFNSANQVWPERWPSIIPGVAGLLWVGGFVWLIWAQIADDEVRLVPLVLVALGSFAMSIGLALTTVNAYRYQRRLAEARERISKQAGLTESGSVVISSAERAVLSEAAGNQVRRTVKESAKQLPELLDDSYAVTLAPEAFDSLAHLAEDRPQQWLEITELISSLQADPRPAAARPLDEIPEAGKVIEANHGVQFSVDEERRRIYVVAIEGEPGTEPDDV